jgi:uncharacterized membrane protein YoaK (UPF0700 family)
LPLLPKPTAAIQLAMAGGLAFLAGATDVHGLTLLRDLFVSFMSGNSTMLGVAIARGDFDRAGKIAGIIAMFVAGATAGSLIAALAGPRHTVIVLLIVTVLLVLPMLAPQWSVPLLIVAMGLLNAAMHRAGATGISLTYVTGALVKFGQGLGLLLCRRQEDASWWKQGVLWACLLTGAAAAAVLELRVGTGIVWTLPVLAAVLTIAAALQGQRLD